MYPRMVVTANLERLGSTVRQEATPRLLVDAQGRPKARMAAAQKAARPVAAARAVEAASRCLSGMRPLRCLAGRLSLETAARAVMVERGACRAHPRKAAQEGTPKNVRHAPNQPSSMVQAVRGTRPDAKVTSISIVLVEPKVATEALDLLAAKEAAAVAASHMPFTRHPVHCSTTTQQPN